MMIEAFGMEGRTMRVLHVILVIVLGFVTGKWCQYAAVEYLGDRFGFNGASMFGLMPFFVGIIYLKGKYPHILGYRRRSKGS